tara:strand:- start:1264 stop:1509 length:246 start_codon:yes stop_codon:yes gene_type:complete
MIPNAMGHVLDANSTISISHLLGFLLGCIRLFLVLEITARLLRLLSLGLPFLWCTSLPLGGFNFLFAALRDALRFFCSGLA